MAQSPTLKPKNLLFSDDLLYIPKKMQSLRLIKMLKISLKPPKKSQELLCQQQLPQSKMKWKLIEVTKMHNNSYLKVFGWDLQLQSTIFSILINLFYQTTLIRQVLALIYFLLSKNQQPQSILQEQINSIVDQLKFQIEDIFIKMIITILWVQIQTINIIHFFLYQNHHMFYSFDQFDIKYQFYIKILFIFQRYLCQYVDGSDLIYSSIICYLLKVLKQYFQNFKNLCQFLFFYISILYNNQILIFNSNEKNKVKFIDNFLQTNISYTFDMNKTQSSRMSKSLKSKYVAKRSQIDEALFGIKPNKTQNPDELKKVTKLIKDDSFKHPEVGILPTGEIERMKNFIRKPTKQQQQLQKKLAQEQKEYKLALAKAKKEHMLKLQEQKKKNIPLNDIQKQKIQQKKQINQKAVQISQQQLDDVKQMNKMVAYAKAATIRERQLQEKQREWQSYKIQQKKKDKIMQLQRLKKIKQQEQIQETKKRQALKGKQVIVDQIRARQIERLKARQEQEREAQILVHKMKQLEKEQQVKVVKKKQQQKVINDQIVQSNKNAILIIEQRKQKQRQQDQKISSYLKQKASKQAQIAEQQKRIKEQKQKQIQRLRELQEKASDRQAELDALRAKRAIQANQRVARQKQRQQAEIRAKKAAQLQVARNQQQMQKQKMLEQQARAEKAQFQSAIRKQRQIRQLEQKLQQQRKQLLKKHASQLKKQIVQKGQLTQQQKKQRQIQNQKSKQIHEQKAKLLQRIKHQKIQELKSLNVPQKYIVELQKKKIH